MKDAQKIRIHNLGHASDCYSSAPGDLLLSIKVEDHDTFKREDLNITAELPITISQAILGAKITVDTVDGKLNIELPPGTQDGDKIILQKYGAWSFNPPENYDPIDLRGDFIISVKVIIPKTFT